MATAVVSGRVDEKTKERADAYIRAAGSTPGDVIRIVWEQIAATGVVPETPAEHEETKRRLEALRAITRLREGMPQHTFLDTMTDEEMKELIAERYV